jgi:hypothetical protein
MYDTHILGGDKIEIGSNLCDPLTLEPFDQQTELLHFKAGNSITTYDFHVFYNAIHKLNEYRIPHTREVFTLNQRQEFDQICIRYNREPIFENLQKKEHFLCDLTACQTETDLFNLGEKYGYIPLNVLNAFNSVESSLKCHL